MTDGLLPGIVTDRQFIGGERVVSTGGGLIESINSATEEVWARVPDGTAEDVDAAVGAA